MHPTASHLRSLGSIPGRGGLFQRIFPWLITPLPTGPEPVWQKMAQSPLNGTTQLWRENG